jgi:hypothetical protein
MIDPTLSLAVSMQASKGVYALLVGSGISKSAGIPIGWDIVLDLIRKLAKAKGEDCEPPVKRRPRHGGSETPHGLNHQWSPAWVSFGKQKRVTYRERRSARKPFPSI